MKKNVSLRVIIAISVFLCLFSNIYSQEKQSIQSIENLASKYEKEGNNMEMARCQSKLGFLYKDENNLAKSTEYFLKAIKSNEILGNLNAIKTICVNVGMNYTETENYDQALIYFKKSLKINEKQGKKLELVADLLNIGQTLQNLKNYTESNQNLEKAVSIAQEFSDIKSLKTCYATLAENYDKLGNSGKSQEFFELASSIKTHMQKEELTKFETRTKQAENEVSIKESEIKSKDSKIQKISKEQQLTLDLLQKQKELVDLKSTEIKSKEKLHLAEQKNTLIIIGSLGMILFLLFIFFLFIAKQLRAKKKANILLQENNQKITEQKKEIEIQRDIANTQKKKITDSILYAQRIQNAILPPLSSIEKAIPDHFILYRPRDIVSGDFYWMTERENFVVLAVVDCTGHGVPGAFMSMLGVAFLNEIINKATFNRHFLSLSANDILNQLRKNVINSLHQSNQSTENKDGMDVSLIIIDYDKMQLQFAGAHNPLYIIRNGELTQYAGDPMPIGVYKNCEESFKNVVLPLVENDLIYLFTDGYYDQFGGEKNFKMLSANFRNYLLEIHNHSMDEQKRLLLEFYDKWKGKREQIDDVTIFGFKFQSQYKISNAPMYKLWRDKRILIAEDVEINFLLLVEALRPTKTQIFRVENGKDAVDFCTTNDVDLILMDIHMPVMNGIEATKLIKAIKPHLPIIAQTAVGSPQDIEEIMEAGCNDYIAKPIDLKLFLSIVRKYLIK